MISGIRGRIRAKQPGVILVELHGITFRVLTSQTTIGDIGGIGDEVELVTHLYVREDQLTLFGFATPEEIQLFELLLTVSGVGPRVALNVLSTARPDEIFRAIEEGAVDTLSRAPGIGKKTAGRIVLDLRGKLPDLIGPGAPLGSAIDTEAFEALQALGYTAAEAKAALAGAERREGQTVEERIIEALQALSSA